MLTQLITKIFTGEAGVFFARMRTVAILYAVMGIFALGLLGFLLGALFIWLASIYGALATALGFAAACLLGLVVLYIVLMIARRPPKDRASDRLQRDIASVASVAAISNLPLLMRSVRRRRSLLLVPVAGIGIFAAVRALSAIRRR
ncbi:hypothetical protein [Aureimonas populi]|uniref:Phage holin family protein n=1 Tax=Aureimonas populi TaxID=1701758 RepID=A0ABW5CGD5_9HYPH|nr:hypothetical protein [Aureimonas populi]